MILYLLAITAFLSANLHQQDPIENVAKAEHDSKNMQTQTFEISEAGIQFQAPAAWSFVSKTGKLENGKVDYNYTHEDHVRGEDRLVNPTIIITVDKGSWFDSEQSYLEEKLDFHRTMGDTIEMNYSPGDDKNPLNIKAHYSEGVSEDLGGPYGEQFKLVTFWTEEAGFHMEIHSSGKHFETMAAEYDAILKSISKM